MTAAELLARLEGVRRTSNGWEARCPAHEDHKPSLCVAEGEKALLLTCQAGCSFEAVCAALQVDPRELFYEHSTNGDGGARPEIVATYDYVDRGGALLFQVVRFFPKGFRQRRPDGPGGWVWKLGDTRRVLYRLPQVLEAVALDKLVWVCEGEEDVHAIERAGQVATTNPGGAGKWRPEYSEVLRGGRVRIVADDDEPGRDHARAVRAALADVAASVDVVVPKEGKDARDHLTAGHSLSDLVPLADEPEVGATGVEDFYAYLPEHRYIFVPARDTWPASSVNARLGQLTDPDTGKTVNASTYLDAHRSVEQMTWAPGEPEIIEDRLVSHGGWLEHSGSRVFNLYRAPQLQAGDPSRASPWLDHVHRVFPAEADHLIRWLAHRVQEPGEKINHALVLGGPQGIGKDTLLEPVKHAVGAWNFVEVAPAHLLGRFNGFVKAVVLRVSEARDLGDVDRYGFYEHMKAYTAAPPDVLRCDEKNLREYSVLNVCGVVITTNHKGDGIYLPDDDRRHFVAWSDLTKDDFPADYWTGLWRWYRERGVGDVAAYLANLDLSSFDPKAPPPKTAAFYDIVDANRAPEDAELADALDKLQNPAAITLAEIGRVADDAFSDWLNDRRNRRQVPHRMEEAGYVPVRNDAAKDGLWKVGGRRQVVYGRRELSVRDRVQATTRLVAASR